MLQTSTFKFLSGLAKNNNKPWFEANRDAYEAAKADFEQMVTGILAGLGETEPGFKEQKASSCVFRIYRDVRFSKDKSPYKPNFGAYFSKGGKKFNGAGYYLHLEPGKTFAGGGLWMPEAPLLKAVRQEIDYNLADFKKIIDDKKFKKVYPRIEGEQLKKMPQGYDESNPAGDYLKLKSFVGTHQIGEDVLTSKKAVAKCLEAYDTLRPFIDFLNRSLD